MKRWEEVALLFLVALTSLVISILAIWYIWLNQSGQKPLPDILLDNIPDLSDIEFAIVNTIVVVQYIVGILSFPSRYRFQLIAQFIFLQSVLTTLRAGTSSVTLLPNIHVYPHCEKRPDNFFQVLWYMIQYGTCADYMFSGHTATSTLAWLFTCKWKYLNVVNGVLLLGVITFLLLQRWHYTVDIIIGFIITCALYIVYYKYQSCSWWYFNSLRIKSREERTDYHFSKLECRD